MAKKLNKLRSLDEGEIVLEDIPEAEVVSWDGDVSATVESVQETETFREREQGVENEPVEIALPTNSEPTPTEIKFAKGFKGTPGPVDHASKQLAQSCASKGLLADFGADTYARGFKWHLYCK